MCRFVFSQLLEGKAKAIQQYKQLMANNYVQVC